MYQITEALIEDFRKYLINEEKSQATIEKYIRDLSRFSKWCAKREIEKGLVVQYKKLLISAYAPTSVNSIVSSLNAFFEYAGWIVCKTKTLRIQKQVFIEQNKELSKEE